MPSLLKLHPPKFIEPLSLGETHPTAQAKNPREARRGDHRNSMSAQEHWDLLRPWCQPVRGKLELLVVEDGLELSVGLGVSLLSSTTPAIAATIRESLVLLTILARVDREGFKRVLADFCDLVLNEEKRAAVDEAEGPIFIGVTVTDPGKLVGQMEHIAALLQNFYRAADLPGVPMGNPDRVVNDRRQLTAAFKSFLLPSEQPGSREFAHVARTLVRSAGGSVAEVDVPVAVTVRPGEMEDGTDFAEQIVRTLLSLWESSRGWRFPLSWDSVDTNLEWALAVTKVDVDMQNALLTPSGMQAYEELMATGDGLRISGLRLCDKVAQVFFDNAFSLTAIRGNFFERILCANGRSEEELVRIDNLSFSCRYIVETVVGRLFTALAEARTVRSVTLSFCDEFGAPEMNWHTWSCIAYAFFSKHAHTSIEHVTIEDAYLTADSAEAVAAVLSAVSPSRRVYGIFGDINTGYIYVPNFQPTYHEGRYMLREGTGLTFEEIDEDGNHTITDNDTQMSWTTSTDVVGCRVISEGGERDGEPCVNVLAPGYGVCWVAGKNFMEINSVDTEAEQSPRRLSSLKLSFDDRQNGAEGLYRFLDIVGSSLTRLEVVTPSTQTTFDLNRLLTSCPNLTSFGIEGVRLDAFSLIEVCESHVHWFSELSCEFEDLVALAHELERKDSQLTKNLKCLTTTTAGMRNEETNLKAMAKMLHGNRALQRLDITMSHEAYLNEGCLLKRHHRDGLPIVKERFPVSCRLAFLSVLSSNGETMNPEVKPNEFGINTISRTTGKSPLDRGIVSTIFAFANNPVLRSVSIHS